jgi:phospholipid/cholesterol/gamma-HCH transport system substrate-binding protein
MPRTRSLAWSELKVGILTIAAIVITAVTIILLTGGHGFPWQRYSLKVRFPSAPGLKSGSPVRLAGVEVGTVNSVELSGEQVDILLRVNQRWRPIITSASIARIGSVSMLGEAAVDITPSTTGTPIPEWGYVTAARPTAQLGEIADEAGQGIQEMEGLIHDVRAGRGTVGKLMTDDQLYTEMHRFVATALDLTEGIKRGRGSIGRLLNDPATANALEASVKNIEALTRQINSGEGSLGKLLKDDSFSRSLESATANLGAASAKIDALVARLNNGEGTAGRLVTDSALYDRLNSVTTRLDQLITHLNDGEGTAGQLLKDRQLYENMNKATGDLSTLIEQITRNPKKYLNVKISIF